MRSFYANHDLDSSIPLIREAGPLFNNINFQLLGVPPAKHQEYASFLDTFNYEYKQMNYYWDLLDKKDWEDAGEEDDIRIYTKRSENTVAVLM